MDADLSRDGKISTDAHNTSSAQQSISFKSLEFTINLSLLFLAKRILELYISWRIMQLDSYDGTAEIIWYFLVLLQFSYNIVMVAAIVCSYESDFKAHSKLKKNLLIIFCLFDLDPLLRLLCCQQCQQGDSPDKLQIREIIYKKLKFVCQMSVYSLCSLSFLLGINGMDITLDIIFLYFVYFLILFIRFRTVGEQLRILQLFYLGAILQVGFFLKCHNLICTLLFNESLLIVILLLVSLVVLIKQRNFKVAFASRFMIKELFRIMFFKPAVMLKEFDYLSSPSVPSLLKLYIFKIKFKHLGYVWRIIELLVVPSYLIAYRNSFEDQPQVIRIGSLKSQGGFHYYLNLVLCVLNYFYAIYLIFKVAKIKKFIPELSDDVLLEVEKMRRFEIRSSKEYTLFWQPSQEFESHLFNTCSVSNPQNHPCKINSEYYSKASLRKRQEFIQKESISQKKTSDLEVNCQGKEQNEESCYGDDIENKQIEIKQKNETFNQGTHNKILKYFKSKTAKVDQNQNKSQQVKFQTPKCANKKNKIIRFSSCAEQSNFEALMHNSQLKQKQRNKAIYLQELQSGGLEPIKFDNFHSGSAFKQNPNLNHVFVRTDVPSSSNSNPSSNVLNEVNMSNQQDKLKEQPLNTEYSESTFQPGQILHTQDECNNTMPIQVEKEAHPLIKNQIISPSNVFLMTNTYDDTKKNNILFTNFDEDSILEINQNH